MGDLTTNINITQYYIGKIYGSLAIHEVSLTFCESYEGNWVHTQASRRHFKGAVKPFEKPFAVHKDNQGEIALVISTKMWPHTKHIAINYQHFRSFVANGDIEIKHIDTKE